MFRAIIFITIMSVVLYLILVKKFKKAWDEAILLTIIPIMLSLVIFKLIISM